MRFAAILPSIAVLLASGLPASAQFGGGPAQLSVGLNKTVQGTNQKVLDPIHYGAVSAYPFAPFVTGGRLGDGTAGTTTENGVLFAGTFGIRDHKRSSAFEVGGWYWTKFQSDVYQIHARELFTPRFGFQAAYLGSTAVPGTAYSTFLFYELRSRDQAPNSRRQWNLETGLGVFYDVSNGRNTSTASVYVDAAVEIAPRITLNGTFWYVRDRSQDLNRFALGAGYHF